MRGLYMNGHRIKTILSALKLAIAWEESDLDANTHQWYENPKAEEWFASERNKCRQRIRRFKRLREKILLEQRFVSGEKEE